MADLHIENLTKVYNVHSDPVVGVDDVNIELDEGNFLVLVGPSGCGKSTTLRTVAGLESATEGNIRIGGEVVNNQKPKDRDIAMVFQNYALYPHMTARQNMGFGLKMMTDLSKSEVDERVEDVAETMGIRDLLEDKPDELSGGQQQRVALGRAIVREPQVFLLDEPLSNLDAKLRAHMRTEIKELQQKLDITTVYVTHDQTEAMTMGDKIAVLNNGELQQLGSPLECYHQPANRFVAGFIGEPSMNFFDVEYEGGRLVNESLDYPLSDSLQSDIGNADRLVLGIRPEDAVVANAPDDHSVVGSVTVVEPLGSVNYVHTDVEGEEQIIEVDGNQYADEGQRIAIRLPEENIHLFDADTGDALHNPDVTDETIGHSEFEGGFGEATSD
ncbi:ABC transporter ATP-binding protein [Candidatus Halobonum tyrrellensis]|uniref:ABC-type D-xylose/L-arabinose transporter n=1 Tax=Candidatus Halobonum tyrrellensis G22 TaxID=1324957 RepID=V4HJA4_9EURY|nr:sn-glycerol-3-phosphate ABC transporter ATP-binding protein UgpC [Candidatus Halobonum tyrrellensis]ESP89833.1 sugar ABC transporter ATPase [Candidatus Halobonum tyrrellensis G22]